MSKLILVACFISLIHVSGFSQKIVNRDKLLDPRAMAREGAGAGINSGINPNMIKSYKGEMVIYNGHSNVELKMHAGLATIEEMRVMAKKHGTSIPPNIKFDGQFTLMMSDGGANTMLLNITYIAPEKRSATEYHIAYGVAGMSMHNTHQWPAFLDYGEFDIVVKNGYYYFTGTAGNKAVNNYELRFDGRIPTQYMNGPGNSSNGSNGPGPKRLDPNQESKDAMGRKPVPGAAIPQRIGQ